MTRRKAVSALAKKSAAVSLTRNGLSVEIQGVPADEAGVIAAELLRAFRSLVTAGFDELIVDGGSAHAHPIEVADEVDGEDFVDPAHAIKRPMGFV